MLLDNSNENTARYSSLSTCKEDDDEGSFVVSHADEHSRVKLSTSSNVSNSDYVNASSIVSAIFTLVSPQSVIRRYDNSSICD